MMLLAIGTNHRTAPLALRERLAVPTDRQPQLLRHIADVFQCEVVLVSTCNRVEFYLSQAAGEPAPEFAEKVALALADDFEVRASDLRPSLFLYEGTEAVRHLFRVAASLDSIVLGEQQIAGQVRTAYEQAVSAGSVGPLLHLLFQHARQTAKRIRKETGLTAGKASVSSLAIDYLRQVFDRFDNKTILVIGSGKIGELTLRQLVDLRPHRILVTNRSPERALALANHCGGVAQPWNELDQCLAEADIILSTTGAQVPIVSMKRFQAVLPARSGRPVAIIDLAVPRDFDPAIAALDEVDLLANVDDFRAIREKVLRDRLRHVPAAEQIVQDEVKRFTQDWSRRWTGPAIARLSREWDAIREQVERECLERLNGQLTEADKATVAGALRLLQNKLLHTPIVVLQQEAKEGRAGGLMDAITKLFRLGE